MSLNGLNKEMQAYIEKLRNGMLSSEVKESVFTNSWYDMGYPETPISDYDCDNVFRDVVKSEPIISYPGYSVIKIESKTYIYHRKFNDEIIKVVLYRKEFYTLRDNNNRYFMINKKILDEIFSKN